MFKHDVTKPNITVILNINAATTHLTRIQYW